MSYVSLLKNIPEFLSQPTGIAAIASVGIHGTIAFILPLMPVDSKPKPQEINSSKTVGLVELNQAEQNRLPQVSSPQVAVKPLALDPQLPPPPPSSLQQPLPSIPQSPPTQVILPPLPKSSANLPIPPLPKTQPLQQIPVNNYPINPVSGSLNTTATTPQPLNRFNDKVALGPSQTLPPSNLSELQPAKIPTELPQTNVPIQNVSTSSKQTNIAIDLPQTNTQTQSVSTSSSSRQTNIATDIPSTHLPELQAAKIPSDLRNLPSSTPVNATPEATSPVVGNGSQVLTAMQNRQVIIPVGAASQNKDSNLLRTQQTQSQSNTQQSVAGKTPTFGEQFSQIKKQYPNIETKLPIFGAINAKPGQQGRIDGALIVDAEGKVESVNFMNNSVSSDLQTSTREYFKEYFQNNPVQRTGRPKYYPFSLSLRTDGSSDTLKQTPGRSLQVAEPTNNGSLSVTNQKQQAISELRQKLTDHRRRLSPLVQPSNEQPANISGQSHIPPVNAQSLQPRQVSRISPQTSVKPLNNQGVKRNQPAPLLQSIPQTLSQTKVSSNTSSNSVESGQKLLRRLREVKEQRQNQE
jgi:hypothetical protein